MVTLLTAMGFYLFDYTGRQTFGFAIPGMMQEFGLTKSQPGWCGVLMLWSYAVGQAINGQLPDRPGGRSMMTAGGILSVIFNWIVSISTGLASIAAPWAANGLAQSMGRPPGNRILSNGWDRRHRGVVAISCTLAAGLMAAVKH
jgi:OPA family glycerol-3-phosphate transporter-like MFS transporter